jgi:hypothetical protein
MLFRPALLARRLDSGVVDGLGASSAHPLLHAARALVLGDSASVRRALTAFEETSRGGSVPMGPDFALPGARLWIAIGDTAAAVRMLDRMLTDAPSFDPSLLARDGAIVAAFIRAMAVRAELAAATKDGVAAKRWSTAVGILWGDADPEVRRTARVSATNARW